LQKVYFARKNEPGEKARTNLPKLSLKNIADFGNLTLPKRTQAMKNGFAKRNRLLAKT